MLTIEQSKDLTAELDGVFKLKLGERHAFVALVWSPKDGQFAVLTNRESTKEITMALAFASKKVKDTPAAAWSEVDIDAP